MRRAIVTIALFQATLCFGQTTNAPAFEVASVKVSNAPPGSDSSHSTLGSLSIRNMTLRACIGMAYNVKEFQVLGGPKWLDSDRYDIDAKSAGATQGPERMAMLQTLLAGRFQLVLHRETRTYPGYALVVGKAGLKMRAVEPGKANLSTHNSSMSAEKASMANLAANLSRRSGILVEDATGVTSVFDFKLELPSRDSHAAPNSGDAPGDAASDPASFEAALSHALQDQLGLKLEARKIQQEVLAIDRAEKPPEN